MEKVRGRSRVHVRAWMGPAVAALVMLVPGGYALAWSFQGGFEHYRKFFGQGESAGLVAGSVLYSVWAYIGALALGVLTAWAVPRLRARRLRRAMLCMLLMPVFVPAACWAASMPRLIGENAGVAPWAYGLLASLRGGGMIGFAGAAFALANPGRGFWKGVGWASLLWTFLCLTPDFELVYITQSAATATLDLYAFREGLMRMDIGMASAVFAVKAGLQLLIGGVACGGVYFVFLRGRREPLDTFVREEVTRVPMAWALSVGVLGLGVLLVLMLSLSLGGEEAPLLQSLPRQLALTVLSGGVGFLFAWMMIGGLRTLGRLAFCGMAGIFLALHNPLAGQYALIRGLGLENTLVPVMLTALFSPVGMLLTLLCARLSCTPRLEDKALWRLALLPASYAMANAWGGLAVPFTAFSRLEMFPWGLRMYYGLQQTGQAGTLAYVGVLAVPLLLALLGGWAASYSQ